MKLFTGPRQSGKTEWIINEAKKHGSATIVVASIAEAQMLKHRIKRGCDQAGKYDIKIITFTSFCRDIALGGNFPNVYFDDIGMCLESLSRTRSLVGPNTNIVGGTLLDDDLNRIDSAKLFRDKMTTETDINKEGLVDIKGLNKADVLMALYEASHYQGMSFLGMQKVFVHSDAVKLIDRCIENDTRLRFDYVNGRIIKCDITDDMFDPTFFDRDCGEGAAADAIKKLKNKI